MLHYISKLYVDGGYDGDVVEAITLLLLYILDSGF